MKIYRIISYTVWLCLALMAVSCEKVINIDLHDSQPVVAIQANLPLDSVCTVYITRSIQFSQPDIFPRVYGAALTLTDDKGKSETLHEVDPPSGQYETASLRGAEGRTYTLTVECEGNTYTASSTLPHMVTLDSLKIQKMTIMGKNIFQIIPYFNDPPGIPNWYKMQTAINGVPDGDIRLRSDKYTDGQVNREPVNIHDAKSGDRLTFTMLGIDEAAYTFYNTLRQGSGSSTTPANPISNFSGGCLGYFKAYTTQTVELTIP